MEPNRILYDVALSFAGEDRPYVSKVADGLRAAGLRVFYDEYDRVTLWGKDLYEHLSDVYRKLAHYTVIFISQHYARKVWANHGRRNAQARALQESREYILPTRFDDTEVPGLPTTIAYIDLQDMEPRELVDLIQQKLRLSQTMASPFAALTNDQLRERTLAIVAGIRSLLQEDRRRSDALMYEDFMSSRDEAMTEEERRAAFWKKSAAMSASSTQTMTEYSRQFKVNAILLRDELIYRLPP